jgi:NADPH-dependent 2,4-dienoyl-CoA reductase/sulfur reductase-like enzyme/nitrite reductase/ring-hydroxylating ferredoxin subunit
MTSDSATPTGPDLRQGIAFGDLPDGGMLAGHAGGEAVLLARRGEDVFAVSAVCTHYGGPLAEGLVVGETVRCPWHHACFSLRTGEALRAPALNPVSCFRVERRNGAVYVQEKLERAAPRALTSPTLPRSVVIVGGGAAANAAAETLRNEGYPGRITMLSADDSGPYDRPNLSKGFLAGSAEEDWIPLRSPDFYKENNIDLKLATRVAALDPSSRKLRLADGSELMYDALLLATGAEPLRINLPGGDLAHVHYLRTLADSRAIIAKIQAARRAVVLGASFIGLEVAASLRARTIEVAVVAPETIPMERILGADAGNFIRQLHEGHGVTFHLGTTAASISAQSVILRNGETLDADLVAERQGQTAARNILGARERFDAVPFFWTEQYDLQIAYVGHAERWDKAEIEGSLEARDCTISYRRGGKKLAVAAIGRDLAGLEAEVAFERATASE